MNSKTSAYRFGRDPCRTVKQRHVVVPLFICLFRNFFFIFFALCLTRLAVYIFSLSPFSPFFPVIQFDPFSGDEEEEEEKFRSCTSIVVGRGEGDEQQQRRRLCFYQLMFFYCI